MARLQTWLQEVLISTDGEQTFKNIGCPDSVSLDGTNAEIDASCFDDGQDEFILPGKRSRSFNVNGIYDEDSEGQDCLYLANEDAVTVSVIYRPAGTGTGLRQYKFKISLTGFNIDGTGDVVRYAMTSRVQGAVTRTVQS